jgi:hypothetical protein
MSLDPSLPNTEVLFSVDVELTGPSAARHSVLAIGTCLGTVHGIVIERRRWAFAPLPGDEWDDQTQREFWSKIPDVRKELVAEARTAPAPRVQFDAFVAYVREKVADAYPRVRLVSDCQVIDIGRIDALGARLGVPCDSLKFLYRGRFTEVVDPDERLAQARLLLGDERVDRELDVFHRAKQSPPHDHRPEHDAERTYYEAVFALGMGRVVSV